MAKYQVNIRNSKLDKVLEGWEIEAESPERAMLEAVTHLMRDTSHTDLHSGSVRKVPRDPGTLVDELFLFATDSYGHAQLTWAGQVIFRPGF